jgi:hypothetical protein
MTFTGTEGQTALCELLSPWHEFGEVEHHLGRLEEAIRLGTSSHTTIASITMTQQPFQNIARLSGRWRKKSFEKKSIDSSSWVNEDILRLAKHRQSPHLLIVDLGWTVQEAWETRTRLIGFEEDWNVPGMELYDEL